MDPLGEALRFLRTSDSRYTRSELTAPWGLAIPALPGCLTLHLVASGHCWLEVRRAAPRRLQTGDLALIAHGESHRLLSGPGAAARGFFDMPRERVSERYELVRHHGGGAATTVACAAFRFDHPAAQRLLAVLPRVIVIDAARSPRTEWIEHTMRLMTAEAEAPRPGGEAILTRLADVLVIQAIRTWIEGEPAAQPGWLGALRDERIGRAVALIHREPARPWTLASLAGEAAMSRSAFAERFAELVGTPPMAYLARWRMHLAAAWLEEHDAGLGELAGRIGYGSEAAFSRAFKRIVGVAPSAVRRRA